MRSGRSKRGWGSSEGRRRSSSEPASPGHGHGRSDERGGGRKLEFGEKSTPRRRERRSRERSPRTTRRQRRSRSSSPDLRRRRSSSEPPAPSPNRDGSPPPPLPPASGELRRLVEHLPRSTLEDLLDYAALSDPSTLRRIHAAADRDASHRTLFLHDLPLDVTEDEIVRHFEPTGALTCEVSTVNRTKAIAFAKFNRRVDSIRALLTSNRHLPHGRGRFQIAPLVPHLSAPPPPTAVSYTPLPPPQPQVGYIDEGFGYYYQQHQPPAVVVYGEGNFQQ